MIAPRVVGLPGAQLLGGDRLSKRAAGGKVRQEHGFLGAEDRGGLSHEMHAAEDDQPGIALRRLAR